MIHGQDSGCACSICELSRREKQADSNQKASEQTGKKYVIFDLDNCIADDEHRIKFIDWSKSGSERYEAYHEAHVRDRCVNDHFPQFLKNIEPIFITGRPEKYRQSTLAWLGRNGVLLNDASHSLWMRPNVVCDHDSVRLKLNVVKHLEHAHGIKPEQILVAYDDREDVVAMYNAHGVTAEVLAIHDTPYDKFKEQGVDVVAQDASEMSQEDKDERKSVPHTFAIDMFNAFAFKPFLDSIIEEHEEEQRNPSNILNNMAETYEERNKVYGDNYKRVGAVMASMFPDGVQLKTEEDFNRWHLFELKIVKLTRFANSGLLHKDSIHDDAVYSAMVESLIDEDTAPIGSGVQQENVDE